jgi:hypothetical protein
MSQKDLTQADLSGLSLKQMNAAQREEMRRRLRTFMESFAGRAPSAGAETPKPVRKWVPGMKA